MALGASRVGDRGQTIFLWVMSRHLRPQGGSGVFAGWGLGREGAGPVSANGSLGWRSSPWVLPCLKSRPHGTELQGAFSSPAAVV